MLFAEIDEKETIRQVKRKLGEYPRLREIACDQPIQRVTTVYTFEPRSQGAPSKQVETLAIRRVDAMSELEEIEQAVSRLLKPYYRLILFDKYLANEPLTNYEIQEKLWVEKTKFQEYLNRACLAFAEQYRKGKLLVFEKSELFAET
ncbi:Phage protein [Streptococcus oralis]|uniref:Phage protein n=1 Tax=Streptococcus oralis TaxID=1303 RepID=A0A139RIK5_STROR|nr:ArpU family phage packaging/lysis transcriptional regulator [Streptococcus oralis]KXU14580.1 Phage protein [Streptococcus oralis]